MTRHLDRGHGPALVTGGHGPALVMVPGLAATAEFFSAAVARLATRHRVVVVELPGHGDNATADRPASLTRAAEDLHTTIEELDLAGVTLLGWSLGATVAYGYLERFGAARIRALVSVEQTPRLLCDDDWPYGAFGSLDAAGADAVLASVTDDYPAFAAALVRGSFAAGTDPDPTTLADLIDQTRRCDPDAVRALLAEALTVDWRDRLRRISVPTLLVHGAHSQVYPGEVGGWLRSAIPASRLEVFPGSGHLPFVEEPDRFADLVSAFVDHPVAT
ncbi:alpha/beta hydrolase [Solwaraspora sp. WMMA2065]|uniref:alpha/beta fold hydrolase n=1 Tax=Solwaraspora sp. WMMA2065 TaxID=3015166 RepID=UPI00259B6466|nr:alpha/beta hydrolase [Solwaraspora sp. WMMA2065]WJK35190.1 alpha/beta hydrolase [Solwaraspora sp. WMMA2065]